MPRLTDHVAIVTGGAQGIGGATARRLAEEGAKVLIVDVDQKTAEQNIATIQAAGGVADFMAGDVGEHATIKAMVARAVELWGKLTILVNNAYNTAGGASAAGSAVEVSEETWDRGMALLVKSIYLGAKYAVPEMEKAGGGSIVNLSSVHGFLMAERSLVYEAGKAAVIGVTKQMACDFGPIGIRVNAVCPGHIVTEKIGANWARNPGALRFMEQQYPVRRTGKPVDIANAIVFLCSDEASFVTGHALVVDGGLTIQLQENIGLRLAQWSKANPEMALPG